MAKYLVYETRTELISYEVEAYSAQDAIDRYLAEGEEINSKLVGDSIVEAELAE